MTQPAIAPYVPTYATRSPYITATEYLNSPTGVDTSQLVPAGTVAQNQAALQSQIGKASSWADSLCAQVLCATLDIQAGQYRMQRGGIIAVPVDYTPVVMVTDVKWGYRPGALQDLTDLTDVWPNGKVVEIPLLTANTVTNLTPPPAPGILGRTGYVYAQVSYVNGYANTILAAAATAGQSSITVASAFGLVPGLQLTLSDGAVTEGVTIASGYTLNSTTVPLTAPLLNNHAVGTSFSAFPLSIKQAVISLTNALIKTRGAAAVEIGSIHETPGKVDDIEAGGMTDLEIAVDLLGPFRRVI
jgi:hypothetical protein